MACIACNLMVCSHGLIKQEVAMLTITAGPRCVGKLTIGGMITYAITPDSKTD